jgi:hypothetical protein
MNGIGDIDEQKEIPTFRHPEILNVREMLVKKSINELGDLDDLSFYCENLIRFVFQVVYPSYSLNS